MEKPILKYNQVFNDERGTFAPLSLFDNDKVWLQSNISVNPKKNTFRGLHFQNNVYAQTKLVKVIKGNITDFIVDIREDSDTYMKVYKYEMGEGDELYVPKGFAHGFLTEEDNTIVQYLVDNYYSPNNEGVLCFKEFNEINHHFENKGINTFDDIIINNKDRESKNFEKY